MRSENLPIPRRSAAFAPLAAKPPSAKTHGLAPQTPAAKLHPKEHGAYAILAIPILSALVIGGVTLVGVAIAAAAVAGFLAHEPLLVIWGHRGSRALRSTPAATSRLAGMLLITLAAGGVALLAGQQEVRFALLACLVLAASSFVVAAIGRHRSLAGELWGAVVLSSVCVPILLAGDAGVGSALSVWAVWLLGFFATTIAVRSVIASQKRQPRQTHVAILTVISLVIGIAWLLGLFWPLVTLPMLVLSWYLLVLPPPAKQLKRIGWTLVAGTVLTALLTIIVF